MKKDIKAPDGTVIRHDTDGLADDIFMPAGSTHVERMADNHVWIRMGDVVIDLMAKGNISIEARVERIVTEPSDKGGAS